MKHYGSFVVDSLESIRFDHTSYGLSYCRRHPNKEFTMRPEYEIIGEESCGYAIKVGRRPRTFFVTQKTRSSVDEFGYLYGIATSARDWHFLLYSPGEISQASEVPVTIEFNKKALNKDSEEYRNGVNKVLAVVIGLLKDRACAEGDSPSKKKARIELYRLKLQACIIVRRH